MKCPFCKKSINKNNGKHIYNCVKNKNIKDINKIKFSYISYNYPLISKKNIIYNDYVINAKSFIDIRREYGISYRNIDFLLNYYNINKRFKSNSFNKISVNKYKNTCFNKYGVDNVSKLEEITRCKKPEFKETKILDIISNNILIYEWLKNESLFGDLENIYINKNKDIVKKEYVKIIKEYNKHWINLNDDEKNKLINKNSNLEKFISDLFNKVNISYISNFKLGKKCFDFRINNTKILIDVNSDFWHANPKIYKKNEILRFPFKKEKVINIWDYDNKKIKYAINKGYRVIVIWEHEILNLNNNDLSFFIKKLV
jgi:G:T-mismatch repair DNA endonuclease (very short patch repair protein)